MSSARQALTIVGGFVGNALLPGVGGFIGQAVGGEIGGAIDGPPEGPRLDDTSAPALQFGSKVPRLYGNPWCTLSPRWWSGLRESSAVVGGKGADSGQEQFTYSCDMLGVLGEVDLTRWPNPVWTRIRIDGKVVASRLAASSAETLALTAETEAYADAELFNGEATQVPWSVMEAVEGPTNANAYRGVVSMGFTGLQMPNGRQPSLIEVEIATEATASATAALVRLQSEYAVEGDTQDISSFAALNGLGTTTGIASVSAAGINTNSAINQDAYHRWQSTALAVPASTVLNIRWCATISDNGGLTSELMEFVSDVGVGNKTFRVSVVGSNIAGFYGLELVTNSTNTFQYGVIPHGVETHFLLVIQPGSGGTTVYMNGVAAISLGSVDPSGTTGRLQFGPRAYGGIGSGPRDFLIKDVRVEYGAVDTASTSCVFPAPDAAYDIYTPINADLQDVLGSEMLRCAPLTAGQIDMAATAGKEVRGFKAADSAAKSCATLLDWFYYDLFCTDKITAVLRGGAVEQTIPYGYTGAGLNDASDPFAGLIRENDVERQLATAVSYINILADGETDTQTGDRIGAGSEIAQINFPIYAIPTEAKGRADTITHDTRVAAHTATVRLGALHAARMQPGSVVTLTDNKGNAYRVRVARLVWNRGVYDCDVVLDDPNILTSVGITTEIDTQVIELVAPPVAEFLALDPPKLAAGADSPSYLGMVKTDTSAGARWYDSADDVTYAARADYANDAVFGSVTAASGTFARGVLFDEGSSLIVNVGDGTLSSATRAALLADRTLNAFVVGINGRLALGQYRTATIVSAGIYTLSGFVDMGAKGTEQYCASIVAGDRFALLGTSGAALIPRTLAQLGALVYVKGVASGRTVAGVTAASLTPMGVHLKPLSPVSARAARDVATGDIALTWTRRTREETRFGGDLGDACPLGESAEQYRVRLYTSNTYTTLLRDLGVVNAAAAPYTSAQRTADGLALTDPLYVDVRQLSAVVGEGYALQGTA